MTALVRFALARPRTITVSALIIVILGVLSAKTIPVDILPVYNSPAVEVLTFYRGMPAGEVASSITNRMERWTGGVGGMKRQESRSILGASMVRNYFHQTVDANAALAQVTSLALADMPNLPPGTLPPVILPFDPTATVPVCIVALDSPSQGQAVLYDVARYEVRNMIMGVPGSNAPVVAGGMNRVILAYLDRIKMQARKLSPLDVMKALDEYNVFLPSGHAIFGQQDYMIGSNSLYSAVDAMGDIPIRRGDDQFDFLGDVATPTDSHLIQETMVRVNGRRQVYIPVFKQHGASTLSVVDGLRKALPDMPSRLTHPDTKLELVMDQSVYVRQSIRSLIVEAGLGAVLCSLVILLFLGQLSMTAIAVLLIPLALLASIMVLYYTDETINVMTLAGMALAIGPLVDLAIVVLENTHRHLRTATTAAQAALSGASEIVMPEVVATFSTLLVLAPLALIPGEGQFLFRPMALAVTYTMIAGLILALSFVPARAAKWLRPAGAPPSRWRLPIVSRGLGWFDARVERAIGWYARKLRWIISHSFIVLGTAVVLLGVAAVGCLLLRREFFPQVDAGAFEVYVRAQSGTQLDTTEKRVAGVEQLIHDKLGSDVRLIADELGTRADWSAAYTPNTAPMDAVMKVQLADDRQRTTPQAVSLLRRSLKADPKLADLDVAFNASGIVGSALNEGRPTPINIRVSGTDVTLAHDIASRMLPEIQRIDGVVDPRIVQRLDYPQFLVNVDRAKARSLGFTQQDVMKNVIAALNSSVQFNKRNFWIDPVTKNQYYVGVQYPEKDIQSLTTMLNIPLTSEDQQTPVPLGNLVSLSPTTVPSEITHSNLETVIDLALNIEGRDLGHVADDVEQVVARFGQSDGATTWTAYRPKAGGEKQLVRGTKIHMSGEFERMRDTFRNFAGGIVLALVLIYFLMVMLLDSYLVPLVILAAVPIGLVGVVPVLLLSGTAISVQSLLGVIFTIGIIVANAVLLADFAQALRKQGKSPREAVLEAAELRARPVVMTALAAFFALLPMALALERGSEANAPLGRAVLGGLVAGVMATLVVVPALYVLVIRDPARQDPAPAAEPTAAP